MPLTAIIFWQVVFIDHNAHLTTFIDPRLPYAGNEGQAGSEVATRAPSEIQVRTRRLCYICYAQQFQL